jgi:competence protein ComEC
MRHLADWLAQVPGSDVPMPAWPVIAIVIFYALLLLPAIPTARAWVKRAMAFGPAVACVLLLMLPWLIGFAPRNSGQQLTLTLMSVGAGQCAIVETPDGKVILIDAGSSTVNDLHRRCIEPYLRSKGRRNIDAVFVSHANLDHFSAVGDIVESGNLGALYVTPQFAAHSRSNYPAAVLLRRIGDKRVPIHTTTAGQSIDLDTLTKLEVLWPHPSAAVLSANNTSQVMRLTCHGRSILFTGDIQQPALERLSRGRLAADIVIAPHHGSSEAATKAFLQAIGARWILASNDRTLSRKQKEFESLITSQTLLRTHEGGAITVRVRKEGTLDVKPFLN